MNRMLTALALLSATGAMSGCGRDRVTGPSQVFPPSSTTATQASPPPPPPLPASAAIPDRIAGTPVSLGVPVSGTLQNTDPYCFRQWDSSAVCRQYDLVSPREGTLSATLKRPGPFDPLSDPDVFIVGPDGKWEVTSETSWPAKHVTLRVNQGWAYRVIVMAYAYPQDFDLLVEMQ